MSKQVKSIPMELKINEENRIFEGYASTFGNKDYVNDIVVAGAFKKTISERFPTKQIKVLYQHSQPLGMPLHMEEDSKGLYVKAHISKTTLGNDVLELMRDGVIDRMSIGYDVLQDEENQDGARLLKELRLYEFSPVTFPANDEAIISSVKSIEDMEQLLSKTIGSEELTRLLKEGRVLSKATANKISTAIEALNEVLAAASVEEKHEPPAGTHNENKNIFANYDPQLLQSILANMQKSHNILGGK